jgi:shikimate kinase
MNAPEPQDGPRSGRRIVVVGFMAAGKTCVATALARLLSCEAVDLDRLISEHEKRTIRELIEERGEDSFRETESFMLRDVLEKSRARVIALGGGAWTIEENRELIAAHDCLTIWLDAPFDLCWQRIKREQGTRPLALDRESAHRLYRLRRPIYELAALHVEVKEGLTADETAAEVLNVMRGLQSV